MIKDFLYHVVELDLGCPTLELYNSTLVIKDHHLSYSSSPVLSKTRVCTVIVIISLTGLIKDQLIQLNNKGISACGLNMTVPFCHYSYVHQVIRPTKLFSQCSLIGLSCVQT